MIGASEFVELRKQHINPEIVDVWVGDGNKYYSGQWHKYKETIDHPSIVVEDKDNLHAVDWRFAFKSTIFIRGNNTDRMIKVYELISKYLPERVFIFHNEGDQTEIIDSKGLLSGILE
jgi:hypothetical protein